MPRMGIPMTDPYDSANACLDAAQGLRAAGRLADAERAVRNGIRRYPGDRRFDYALGVLLIDLKRWSEAVEILECALAALPDFLPGRMNLGVALAGCERYEEAEEILRDVVAGRPGDREAHHNLA